MKIHFVSGISGDYVEITTNGEMKTFAYGRNASYSRDLAEESKPFIGDIIKDIAQKEGVNLQNVEVTGYYVFPDKAATEKEITRFRERYMAT